MAKLKSKVYKVNYDKKIGGVGSCLVKAENPTQALQNAKFSVATGKNFRNPKLAESSKYSKPRKQGFAGRN